MQTDTYQFQSPLPGSRPDRRCSGAGGHVGAICFEVPSVVLSTVPLPSSTSGVDPSANGCTGPDRAPGGHDFELGDGSGQPSEQDLVERACCGDDGALEALCRRHWICVHRLVSEMAPGGKDAEEITGEVFARAIDRISTIRCDGRDLCSLLRTIALDIESIGRHPGADLFWCHEGRTPAPSVVTHRVDDDQSSRGRRVSREAIAALPTLSGRHRGILELRLVAGFTVIEVAALWGRSIADVLKVEVGALRALRAEMLPLESETTSGRPG